MKRNTLIAALVLAVLLGALAWALNRGPDDAAPEVITWSVPPLAAAPRLEITAAPGAPLTLSRASGAWRLAAPVEAPVAEPAAQALDKALRGGLKADRALDLPADPGRYGLGEDAPTLALFDGDQLQARLRVGKEEVVEGTFVRRTWVHPEGEQRIYRVQAGLRTDLIKAPDDWRERAITAFDEPDVTALTLAIGGSTLRLQRAEAGWTLEEPAGIALDVPAVQRLIAAAGHLRAEGFGDGVTADAAGLTAPRGSLTFTLRDKPAVTLRIGAQQPPPPAAEGQPQRPGNTWLQAEGAPTLYTIPAFTAESLLKTLGDLRSKEMLNLDAAEVQRLTLSSVPPGGPARTLERTPEGWRQTAPDPAPVDPARADALLKALTKLRARSIPEVTPAEAGLDAAPWRRIDLALTSGATATLYLGAPTGPDDQDRFARLGADGLIFVLPAWTLEAVAQLDAPPSPP